MNDVSWIEVSKINRVEVIDGKGRQFVLYCSSVVGIALQDDGRTMKIFVQETE